MAYTDLERRIVLIACSISAFITPLLSTMMNLSLVSIGEEFAVGSHDLAYVNTAFLLSSVIFMVPLAKVGDIYGKRRTYLAGLLVILVACILAILSPSFWFLIMCRVLMGAGSAAVTCTSMSMIVDVYPPQNRGGAIGMQTMCVYIGLAAGPPIGGVLNDLVGWHNVFFIVLPMTLVSMALMSRIRWEISPDKGGRFDSRGTILYALAISLTMGGVINMPQTWAFVATVVGVVFLFLFIRSQSSCPHRLLKTSLFRNRVFSGACIATFLSYAASYSISFFLALYLQHIGGLTATEAGILMLVQPGVQAFGTPMFGRLSDRVADKRILPTVGMLIIAAGLLSMMTYGLDTSFVQIVLTMVVIGVGFSFFSAPNTSVIMGSVGRNDTGEASAMASVMRQTGMMVSMGIAMVYIAVIMGSADNISPSTYGDFLDVLMYSFGTCFAMCILGAFLSMLRKKDGGTED